MVMASIQVEFTAVVSKLQAKLFAVQAENQTSKAKASPFSKSESVDQKIVKQIDLLGL